MLKAFISLFSPFVTQGFIRGLPNAAKLPRNGLLHRFVMEGWDSIDESLNRQPPCPRSDEQVGKPKAACQACFFTRNLSIWNKGGILHPGSCRNGYGGQTSWNTSAHNWTDLSWGQVSVCNEERRAPAPTTMVKRRVTSV